MSKKDKRRKQNPKPSRKTKNGSFGMPSAQTLFHILARDTGARATIDRARAMLGPLLQLRDRTNVQQIKDARTASELVELAPTSTGIAEGIWFERVQSFGPEIVPLIAQRLKTLSALSGADKRELTLDRLVTALRWEGDAGAQALYDSFGSLDEYAQSLACVALGLLKYKPGADLMWRFYQRVANKPDSYLVGALWGLIDLADPRAGEALVNLLIAGDRFEELYGFLALAGDERAIGPLAAVLQAHKNEAEEGGMALACIAHRIGRKAFVAELQRLAPDGTPAELEKAADQVFRFPREQVEKYFDLYFHSFQPIDLAKALGHLM